MANRIEDIKPYTLWKDYDGRHITVTDTSDNLVEYAYAEQASLYYLRKETFVSSFQLVPDGTKISDAKRKVLMTQLEACLKVIKEKDLGDHVYAIMEELGM